jgi:hypothetical protein
MVKTLSRARPFRAARACVTHRLRLWDEALANNTCWAIAVALVAVLQAALILTHQPWLDEVQAIQLAVEAKDLPTLFGWLRYEGHPPLFYLMLRALAHFARPLDALVVLGAALALVTQACILFRSPFTRSERLMIAVSEFVLFEFLTLSRSMTLGVAVIVVTATFWRSRWAWLGIAVLPMCDFLFGVLSVILVALKLRDKDVSWPGAAAWLASGLLAAYLVIPPDDMLPALETNGLPRDVIAYLTALGTLAVPFQGGLLPRWDMPPFPLAGVLWIPFVHLCWSSTRGDMLHRAVLFAFIGLTFAFSIAVYPLAIRHLMLIALLLIVLTWFRRTEGERPHASFRLWLAVAALCGVATAAMNLARPFDTAREAAGTIRRLGLEHEHWMVWPDSRAQVVAALTGMEFERTERHCMQSAIRWNYRTTLTKERPLVDYLASEVERHGRFYMLSDTGIDGIGGPGLVRQIAKIPPGYDGQAYYIYVIGADAAPRPQTLPSCMAGRRPFATL